MACLSGEANSTYLSSTFDVPSAKYAARRDLPSFVFAQSSIPGTFHKRIKNVLSYLISDEQKKEQKTVT